MPNDDLKQAIASSFLNKERMQVVLQILETEGATTSFWSVLQHEMIAEIEKRGRGVEEEMSRFDEELLRLDTEMHERSERALRDLTARLEKIAPSDMAVKGQLWGEYYRAQEQAQIEYEKTLKAKISDMTMRLLK